jgi:hypothetical protein
MVTDSEGMSFETRAEMRLELGRAIGEWGE